MRPTPPPPSCKITFKKKNLYPLYFHINESWPRTRPLLRLLLPFFQCRCWRGTPLHLCLCFHTTGHWLFSYQKVGVGSAQLRCTMILVCVVDSKVRQELVEQHVMCWLSRAKNSHSSAATFHRIRWQWTDCKTSHWQLSPDQMAVNRL